MIKKVTFCLFMALAATSRQEHGHAQHHTQQSIHQQSSEHNHDHHDHEHDHRHDHDHQHDHNHQRQHQQQPQQNLEVQYKFLQEQQQIKQPHFQTLKQRTSESYLQKLYKLYDANSDGLLTMKQLFDYFQVQYKKYPQLIVQTKQNVTPMFQAADLDGDGLTMQEFVLMATKTKEELNQKQYGDKRGPPENNTNAENKGENKSEVENSGHEQL